MYLKLTTKLVILFASMLLILQSNALAQFNDYTLKLGIQANMVVSENGNRGLLEKTKNDPSCFSSPSLSEITVHGKKICGSAQRRVNGAFLQHGSILLEFDPAKLSEVVVFKGLNKDDVIRYLRTNITSVNEQLNRNIGFSEIMKVFAESFEEGLEIDLQEGPLNKQEQELEQKFCSSAKVERLRGEWV